MLTSYSCPYQAALVQIPIGIGTADELLHYGRRAGLKMLAAAPAASKATSDMDLPRAVTSLRQSKVGLVLGSEGKGIRPSVISVCAPVSLAMQRGMESLNVAAAGAIYMTVLSECLEAVVLEASEQLADDSDVKLD